MLTGRKRLRHYKTWLGLPKLILQVEYIDTYTDPQFFDTHKSLLWRDATVEDISELFVRDLV